MILKMSDVIDAEWLRVSPIRVGGVPTGEGTPGCYVTVTDADQPVLRVDVYAYGPDCFAFRDAVIWHGNLVIGFGSYVHVVPLTTYSVVTIPLGEYFSHLYPTVEYLLIASGVRIFRLEPDCSILWKSEVLAIDGVLVHSPGPPVIRGEAEFDPPGGWRPFALSAVDGRTVASSHEMATG